MNDTPMMQNNPATTNSSNDAVNKLSHNDFGQNKPATIFNNGDLYQNEAKLLKFIPPIPDSFSFSSENFQSDSFSVDGFVKRNGKRVHSLEKLKEELTNYTKLLKHSMVNLINEDYTEFINLSTNLISFDKSINNIKSPILKFKDETSHVQSKIAEIIGHLNAKQTRLKTIRDNKVRISMILEIFTNLNRVEANLSDIGPLLPSNDLFDSDNTAKQSMNYLRLTENSTLIAHLQTNFNYLLANNDILEKHPNHLLVKLKQRYDKCSLKFYQQMERELCSLLSYNLADLNDEKKLNEITQLIEKLMRVYLMNDNQKKLEMIICQNIVKPEFDSIIHDSYINKNGAQRMFEKILEFLDTKCALLIKVLTSSRTLSHDNSGGLSDVGYELLTSTIWKEFAEDCIVRTSSLFSIANVDDFYRNYALTFRFIEDFLHKTSLIEYREQFEDQKNYHELKKKFNLNVYFYIRLQQVVSSIEKGFTEQRFSFCANPANQYRLNVTNIMHQALFRCWQTDADKNYVGDLFGYLWKMTLKIVLRFASWLEAVSTEKITEWMHTFNASNTDLVKTTCNETLAAMIFDAQAFIAHFTSLFQAVIVPLWTNHYRRLQSKIQKLQTASVRKITIVQSSLDASFTDTITVFHSVAVKHLIQLMKTEIINECTLSLDFVNDIPRLYRRTNKEKPSRASAYIGKCCQQLHERLTLIGVESNEQWKQQWIAELLHDLTLYYKNATLEVLTSVQKTEDSLKKLKKAKQPAVSRNLSSSMSDDDKIRLQIYYDVQELGTELQTKLQFNLHAIKPYHELTEMVNSLKILV